VNAFIKVAVNILLVASLLVAQEPSTADNPLAVLKDEVKRTLEAAQLPFTAEQERAVVLMMEDRRTASEELFGGLMDFSAGPTQGQDADRLQSAIDWMRNEFLTRLQNYLTAEQLAAWSRHREAVAQSVSDTESAAQPRGRTAQETQYVRINNNIFSSEENSFSWGQSTTRRATEVIQRGGAGGFHGNFQMLLKDESLNAGRRSYSLGQRVPTVKPPYQERRLNLSVSGPVIPGRLTTSLSARQDEAENVDTINALLSDRTAFSLEVVRPTINRSFGTGGTYQITDQHSLNYNISYAPYSQKSQGIGGFVLPERASTTTGNDWFFELKQFSALSPQSIYETRFNVGTSRDETIPALEATRINVLDAFSNGGSQNRSESTGRTYTVSNLYTRLGERLTIKAGMEGISRQSRTYSTSNFGGTFTFSSIEAYQEGRPLNYRVSRGEPLLETNQLEFSIFMQNDLKLTPRLTAMFGLRYDVQSNIRDYNNFGPRLAFAYGISQATVLRVGGGFFSNRVPIALIETQKRLDGKRQFEIVIDNPSYPDAFQSGTVRNIPPSIRVTDPDFTSPYIEAVMISLERTFLTNLFLSASYDFHHEIHRGRVRNINAPFDTTAPFPRSCSPGQSPATCLRPDSTMGQVVNLESTGGQIGHSIRLNFRKRFSIFTASATYDFLKVKANGMPNTAEIPADNYNLRDEWSAAGRFPVHTWGSTVNAQLPLGVFLTGTMSADSGRPYSITTGKDDNMDGTVNDRPPGHQRNTERGPKFLVFNFNISKAFFFGGTANGGTRTNLNAFANMTNAFNNINYGPRSAVMTSPNFGLSTSALDPRQIEVGLRFQF
jgi:hypothetical protein